MFDRQAYMKEYLKNYRQENKERLYKGQREWRAQNPDRVKESAHRTWEKRKGQVYEQRKQDRKERGEEINAKLHDYRESTVRTFLSKKMSYIRKRKRGDIANDTFNVRVTLDHLVELWDSQGGRCALTGKKMEHKFGSPFTVSLDRIDSNFGYFVGNVQLVCQAANFAKNSFLNEEFLRFWKYDSEDAVWPIEYQI